MHYIILLNIIVFISELRAKIVRGNRIVGKLRIHIYII